MASSALQTYVPSVRSISVTLPVMATGDRPLPGPGERDASDTVTRPCVMSNLSLSAPAMTLLRESFNKEATVLQTRPGMSHDVAMSKEYLMTRLLRALRR